MNLYEQYLKISIQQFEMEGVPARTVIVDEEGNIKIICNDRINDGEMLAFLYGYNSEQIGTYGKIKIFQITKERDFFGEALWN